MNTSFGGFCTALTQSGPTAFAMEVRRGVLGSVAPLLLAPLRSALMCMRPCAILWQDHAATNYFQHCQFVGAEPVMDFVAALSAVGSKCVLAQSKPPLTDKDVGCIAEALRDSGIVELHLTGNEITMNGAEDIAAALRINQNILRLSVGDNSVSDEGALSFAAALKDNTTLTWLDLQGNSIGNRGVAGLAEVLTTNQTLQELLLQRNEVQCQGLAALVEALKPNNSLRSLNMSLNKIADVGAAAVGHALKLNSSLVELDLAGNTINPDGGVAIGAGIATNTQLRVLNLGDNAVGDAGAISFANALSNSSSCTLEVLLLRNNRIGVQGCVALADSLMLNSKLLSLDLHGNPGTQQRAGSLAFAVCQYRIDLSLEFDYLIRGSSVPDLACGYWMRAN